MFIVYFILNALMQYELVLVERAKETFNSFPSNLYSSLYPTLIGLLFALPKFVQVIKAEGRWNFDWIRIVAVGIPTLFGATVILIYFSPLGTYFPSISILSVGTKFSTICGIVLGYLILSCFQKSNIDP
ncbi:hypothetical protein ADS79_16620 [Brevibacillus reuszeri]|uniref:Uncharacterized protein n=1 Tax=Brevibacillus reuszeri TaxID=54915 RepID=A0A0K9YP91_9BACL|nr:hypothetical protein ADS79_16620 [Brevibacillus reuszeri]